MVDHYAAQVYGTPQEITAILDSDTVTEAQVLQIKKCIKTGGAIANSFVQSPQFARWLQTDKDLLIQMQKEGKLG